MMFTQIKALHQRLFADQVFLHAFLRDPNTALAGEAFSTAERRTVLRLHTRLVAAGGVGELSSGPSYPWP